MDDEIDVWGLTHTGKVRKNNEHHFLPAAEWEASPDVP